jgi:hypothetical protein
VERATQSARSRRLDRHHSTLGMATESRLNATTVCRTFTFPSVLYGERLNQRLLTHRSNRRNLGR